MCQHSVADGLVDDYPLVRLGRFAPGGFGLGVVEATAVTPEGRISPGDVGPWSDAHVHAWRELTGGSHDAYPVQAGPRLAGRSRLLDRLARGPAPGRCRSNTPREQGPLPGPLARSGTPRRGP